MTVGDDVVAALGVGGTAGDPLEALGHQHFGFQGFTIEVFFPLVGQNAAGGSSDGFDQSHRYSLLSGFTGHWPLIGEILFVLYMICQWDTMKIVKFHRSLKKFVRFRPLFKGRTASGPDPVRKKDPAASCTFLRFLIHCTHRMNPLDLAEKLLHASVKSYKERKRSFYGRKERLHRGI